MNSSRVVSAVLALALAGLPVFANAQYPTRAIRLVVPFAAAGSADLVARRIAPKVAELLGQQLVIENRGGAGGVVGSDIVAKSAPDGYTLLFASSSHTSNPSMYRKLPFDTVKDFVSIAMIGDLPGVLVAHPSVPAGNFREFVEFARKSPVPATFGSSGSGSFSQLSMELLKIRAGFAATHVPYKGSGMALNDLLAGVINVKMDGYVSSVGHIKAGKMKALAVTSRERIPELPEVPTIAEQGIPGFETTFWMAIVAPAGTPPAVVAKLEEAFVAALKDRTVREMLTSDGIRVIGAGARYVDEVIARELAQWPQVIKAAGLNQE
jgi:tripartite-type tricarboxylate transporter receptor subunit TctC